MPNQTIHVAILAEEPLGWWSGKHYFKEILDGYSWSKKEYTYDIRTTYVSDADIVDGMLQRSSFDVLLVPGGGVGDGEALSKGMIRRPKVRRWKEQIKSYIHNGGSYIGICGGAALFTDLHTGHPQIPRSFMERLYQKSDLGISHVSSYYNWLAMPIFYLFQYRHSERIGATGYVFSFAPGIMRDGTKMYAAGVPIDISVDVTHPLFKGLEHDILRVRWWGGPALRLPESSENHPQCVAWYPRNDFSHDKRTKVAAWQYCGGVRGLIQGVFHAGMLIKQRKLSLRYLPILTYFLAKGWRSTTNSIDLDFANKPCISLETLPNNYHSRILLCTIHPEYHVWWNGHIEEVTPTKATCLATGLHQWKDIDTFQNQGDKELTHTWWMVRRFVAWAAHIPDDHLPPLDEKPLKETGKSLLKNIFYTDDIIKQIQNI